MENQKRNHARGSFKSMGLVIFLGLVFLNSCASLNDPNMWRGVSKAYDDEIYRDWDMKIKASQGVRADRVPQTVIIQQPTSCPSYPYQQCQ